MRGRFRLRRCLLIFILSALLISSFFSPYAVMNVSAAKNIYYVATTGNDSTGDGSITKPWKTIQKGADAAQAGDTVIIRGGTYRETVTPRNSGVEGAPIRFKAAKGESVTVSGCDVISGWSEYTGWIYQASMPWTLGKGKDQVFIDGKVVVQARYPHTNAPGKSYPASLNLSPLWPVLGDFASVYPVPDPPKVTSSTLLNQADNYWNGAIYNGGHGWNWCWQCGVVNSSTNGSLTVSPNTVSNWWFNLQDKNYFPENQQGYLTDSMNCLTYAGSWQNQNNKLYLWTPDGSEPSTHIVEAKRRQLAFDLSNKNYIHLTGLNIFASSITMYNANNCTVRQCDMSYISHFLLWDDSRDGYIDDYNSQTNNGAPQRGEVGIFVGGQNNTIRDSRIAYSAGAGVFLAGLNSNIYNNDIHDCGYTPTYLGCIFISYNPSDANTALNGKKGGHTITYNEIYNSGRGAIHFTSAEKFNSTVQTKYNACTISNNRIHDVCIAGNDGGAIYSFRTDLNAEGPRTKVFNNIIYNNWGKYWSTLCYADNYTYGIDYENNILLRAPFARTNELGDGFTGGNQPYDTQFANNTKKNNYTGTVDDLTIDDYPDKKYFKSGVQPIEPEPVPIGEIEASVTFDAGSNIVAMDATVAPNIQGTVLVKKANGEIDYINQIDENPSGTFSFTYPQINPANGNYSVIMGGKFIKTPWENVFNYTGQLALPIEVTAIKYEKKMPNGTYQDITSAAPQPGTTVRVTLTPDNKANYDIYATIIYAVYDNKLLKNIGKQNVFLEDNSTNPNISFEIDVPENLSQPELRTFIWDISQNMFPFMPGLIFK